MLTRVRLCAAGFGLVAIMSVVPVTAVFASNGHGGSTTTQATLVVSPNPAPANTYVQITGCGYAAGVWVEITVQGPVGLGFTSALTDTTGCLTHSWWSGDPYTYTVQAYENASSKHPTLMASTTLVVQ